MEQNDPSHLLHVWNRQQLIEPKDKLCKQRLQIIVVPSSVFSRENLLKTTKTDEQKIKFKHCLSPINSYLWFLKQMTSSCVSQRYVHFYREEVQPCFRITEQSLDQLEKRIHYVWSGFFHLWFRHRKHIFIPNARLIIVSLRDFKSRLLTLTSSAGGQDFIFSK